MTNIDLDLKNQNNLDIMHKLVLLRHGESKWNLENRFTGWTDVELSTKGIIEAKRSGRLLSKSGFIFDKVYTSVLKRAINTMNYCLKEMRIKNIPIQYHWQLNERHYGDLQGKNKSEIAAIYGSKQVHLWRRSYDIKPPKLNYNDERHPRYSNKYKNLNNINLPSCESLKDTVNRFLPIWHKEIAFDIISKKKILIVAHGNSLRALIKHLDNISDEKIIKLEIPTGIPLVYELNNNLNPIRNYYLTN